LVLSSRCARESGRPIQNASNFRRATTKQCVRRASVAVWSWTVCTCPPARYGLPDLKAEMLAFPTGKHDDQVDALGLVGQLLDKWAPGGVPKIEPGFFLPPRDYVEPYRRDEPLLSLKVL